MATKKPAAKSAKARKPEKKAVTAKSPAGKSARAKAAAKSAATKPSAGAKAAAAKVHAFSAAKSAPAKKEPEVVRPVAAKPVAGKPIVAKPAVEARPVARSQPPTAPSKPEVVATGVITRTVPPAGATAGNYADGDDGDGGDLSLLAGPRNVQPYIVKRGELYMSKEQLEHFREILQNWKRDLMVEVDRTVSHMKDEAANFPDPNDRATQEEEFSLELRTRDRERKLIRKIDEALKRIEDGSYGYCLETGEEIGVKRLEARPVATLSIEAQERRERRERQYGDRDDRYR
jgi:DnaK suppressor protein